MNLKDIIKPKQSPSLSIGLDIWEQKAVGVTDVLARLIAAQEGAVAAVTPDNCLQSPTVQAIVQAVSRRMSVTPVHV